MLQRLEESNKGLFGTTKCVLTFEILNFGVQVSTDLWENSLQLFACFLVNYILLALNPKEELSQRQQNFLLCLF